MNDKIKEAAVVASDENATPPKWERTWEDRVKLAAARKERKAAKQKERYETDPEYREKVKALSKLRRDERKAAKATKPARALVGGSEERPDAPPLG